MNTKHTDSVETLRQEFTKWLTAETTFATGVPDDRSIADWWLEKISSLQATQSQQVEEAVIKERERILGKLSIPERLKETRLHLGLSQEEVGKRLGYSAMAISHFENGNRPIPEKILGEFVMIFGSLVETKANNRRGKALTPNHQD